MMEKLNSIESKALEESRSIADERALEEFRVKYLGKQGELTAVLRSLGQIPKEDRPAVGARVNQVKARIEEAVGRLREELNATRLTRTLSEESLDVSLSGRRWPIGRRHPLTRATEEILDIFIAMGFTVEEGPEVEKDYYNFEALNIPKDHPARDMHDTFYFSEDIVLRTHTSPVQTRVMEKRKPPVRFVCPGASYRVDSDVSHSPMFHQVEGLLVDEDVSFSDLKGVLTVFLHEMFGKDVDLRFRASFFPFTEPSAEVDIACVMCGGRGCRVCKQTGWLEILGAGMVDPEVFRYVGYDSEKYTGFAFGMGIERVAMLKWGIDDIRLFYDNDMRFLSQV